MELKRDIYKELLAWKSKRNHKVLELEGARQVGKTYILEKFAKKEYQSHVYINMIGSSGKDFLQCIETAASWEPGKKRENNPVYKAFQLYDPDFSDCEDLLIVIDEIQESSVVYSKIREFARDFKAHFIVTGSYLGKTREKEYFLSAGDTEVLTMTTLTFPEFLDAFHKRGLYESIDLYGGSDHAGYDELKSYFHTYLQIGGYPEVVTTYLESRSIPFRFISAAGFHLTWGCKRLRNIFTTHFSFIKKLVPHFFNMVYYNILTADLSDAQYHFIIV